MVQQTHFFSTMKTKSLLCREIIAVGSEIHVKHKCATWIELYSFYMLSMWHIK